MEIQKGFETFIKSERLCEPLSRILLAVSGGMDSMLLLSLFVRSGYDVGIAHCNFTLRGAESDADEQLVRDTADALGVPCHVQRFETADYAEANGISIQMAARDLRYAWLEAIRRDEGYDRIAVAHHLNDSLETALINWVRGTGLAGMGGIKPQRGRIIRPLLFATRNQIEEAVDALGIRYREDATNRSPKYARNKIRLEVIPALKELNPDLERTFATHAFLFSESLELVQAQVSELREKLLDEFKPGCFRIRRQAIATLVPQRLLLTELLKPFGFSVAATGDLLRMEETASGKQIEAADHMLHVDREYLFIHPRTEMLDGGEAFISRGDEIVRWGSYEFTVSESLGSEIRAGEHVAQFDADTLSFPLRIRSWQQGDTFRPLGMRGKKKLSDYFISMKIPVFRKEDIPIVTTDTGEIAWVAPHRMDDRFKITDKTKKTITLTCVHVA